MSLHEHFILKYDIIFCLTTRCHLPRGKLEGDFGSKVESDSGSKLEGDSGSKLQSDSARKLEGDSGSGSKLEDDWQ